MYVYVPCGSQKRGVQSSGVKPHCKPWELNTGPLQEQRGLLTPKPSPRAPCVLLCQLSHACLLLLHVVFYPVCPCCADEMNLMKDQEVRAAQAALLFCSPDGLLTSLSLFFPRVSVRL